MARPRNADIHEMPDRGDGGALTHRQRKVLEVIRNSIDRRGYPPSMREIGDAVGLTCPSSVAHQLSALERKGYLRRDPNRPRAIEVISPDTASDGPATAAPPSTTTSTSPASTTSDPRPPTCRCSAGSPPACRSSPRRSSRTSSRSPARSSARARCSCSRWSATRWSTPPSATATGSSCASSRRADNGDIVAAMLDNEATVKTFKRKRRPGLADAAQPGLLADRRRPRHHPRQGDGGPAPHLIPPGRHPRAAHPRTASTTPAAIATNPLRVS